MASAEVEDGARLFFRNADANTWGVLNTREDFADEHPALVQRVLAVYKQARQEGCALRWTKPLAARIERQPFTGEDRQ